MNSRLELGRVQELKIIRIVEFGVYLAVPEDLTGEEGVLLPRRQVPEGLDVGSLISVFLYKDSKDRLIATTNTPKLVLGEMAELKVVQTGEMGAFLDWGLEKDLFLPFREQTKKVKVNESCLAALYIDKSSRLCATMNVYKYLKKDSPYEKDSQVNGRVYEISDEFGAFVAVDNKYSGLIPRKELYGNVQIGDDITARVTAVKEDGKLDLCIREKAYLQIEQDARKIMDTIESYGGSLPFNDKADPETIREQMQMSKNEFKRAVGNLLKQGRIQIIETGIIKK